MARLTNKGLTFLDLLKATAAVLAVILTGGLWRALREVRDIELTQVDLPVADLPETWDGVRIAFVSDLHARPPKDLARLQYLVDLTLSLKADLIVLGGDIFSRGAKHPMTAIPALKRLTAPLGVFAVLGNHDYYHLRETVAAFAQTNIEPLVNRNRILTRNGQELALAGLDDLRRGRFAPRRAMEGISPDTPTVMISHNPDAAEAIPDDYRVDAMLSGHTHGGQVTWWGLGPAALPIRHTKYCSGLVQGPRFPVYISRGMGTVALPIRFHCRPELAVVRLVRPDRPPEAS
jgi:uncharacterized protein